MIAFFFFGGRGEILECHRAISEAGGRKNEYFYDIFVRSKNFVRILQCRLGSVEDNKEYTDRSHAPGSRAGWIEAPITLHPQKVREISLATGADDGRSLIEGTNSKETGWLIGSLRDRRSGFSGAICLHSQDSSPV